MNRQPAGAAEIAEYFRRAAGDLDDEAAVEALFGAFAGLRDHHGEGQLSWQMRERIALALFDSEAVAERIVPAWYWKERMKPAFMCAFGLVAAWGELPGAPERTALGPPQALELVVRVIANDLDSLRAAYAMQRYETPFPVMSMLVPAAPVTAH